MLVAAAFGQRDLQTITDPDAAQELATFHVADGFEVNLFASEPMLAKPIAINFDAEGRLWVVGSPIYPHIVPGEQPADRVFVLDDTNRDGVADTSTVFAEGLFIPTGVLPGDGGVYVSNSTEMLHLSDTDGDGKADKTRVVLDGFGTEDTHHIIHTLRWGMDGMLYFNQSIYIHSHVETPWGVRRLNGGGIWQFRPETMQLEVFARGFVNSWGHHFDDWGQSFATDGAYGEGINYVFPGACFVESKSPKILSGLNPGSPKHCSLEILSGGHLPEDWRGSMITNDFRAHRVCRFAIREDGSGYASTEQPEVIASSHVAFRPVDVKMGPDGAIYIADWYNPIIQHGEVAFRDSRRDREHGRIWRVTAKGRPLLERASIVGQPIEELLDLLKRDEHWVRTWAKIELKGRDKEAVRTATRAWVSSLQSGDPNVEHQRLEALWVFQAIDAPEPELLDALLASADHRVRAAAVRVLTLWKGRLPGRNAGDTFAQLARDENARVRLESVRALGGETAAGSADAALATLDAPTDKFLDHALWLTVRELAPTWLSEVDKGTLAFASDVSRLMVAMKAADQPGVVAPLIKRFQEQALTPELEREAAQLIATHGSADDLSVVFTRAMDVSAGVDRQKGLLRILNETSARRGLVPSGDLGALSNAINASDEELKALAVAAVGTWKVESVRSGVEGLATTDSTPGAIREAAIQTLAALGGERSSEVLRQLAASEQAGSARAHAALGVAKINRDEGIALMAKMLAATPDETATAILLQGVLKTDGGPAALTAAVANLAVAPDTAKRAERIISSSGRNEEELIKALRASAGLGEVREPTQEEVIAFAGEALAQGNVADGEAQYRRLECMKCHGIGGSGGVLGPDLTSIGGSAQADYLVASLLQPNSAIKEGFHSIIVETDDLQSYSGIKVRESDTDLVLRDANTNEITLAKSSIESTRDGQSLMPSGLTDGLLRGEFVNLVRFLTELGRAPEYSVGTTRRARTWRVLASSQPAAQTLQNTEFGAAGSDSADFTWVSAYSAVSGSFPLGEIPKLSHPLWQGNRGVARCQLDVTGAGNVTVRIGNPAGLRLWVGTDEVPMQEQVTFVVAPGIATLSFVVDFSQRMDPITVEMVDAEGAAAAQFVGGR